MMDFVPYPFARLRELVRDITPKGEIFSLTVGEPQFDTPHFIQDELAKNAHLLRKYPPSAGESYLKNAQIDFVEKRFGVRLESAQLIPTFGTREVLFNFPLFYFGMFRQSPKKTMAFPNPFYQIYEGAAIASGAKMIYMPLDSANNFTPQLSNDTLKSVDLVILNTPNNPTGAALSKDELIKWVNLALEFDFVILSDECYSEIYAQSPPSGILEASVVAGNAAFRNVLCVNSISKRSSAPGLRSGFIAGDGKILESYALYRSYIGCAIPLPLQKAAALAWSEWESTQIFRNIYAENLRAAGEILGRDINPYTFYVWLKVGDDDKAWCKNLYENEGILTLPGSFLGRNGVGRGFVRLALVYENALIRDILERVGRWI